MPPFADSVRFRVVGKSPDYGKWLRPKKLSDAVNVRCAPLGKSWVADHAVADLTGGKARLFADNFFQHLDFSLVSFANHPFISRQSSHRC